MMVKNIEQSIYLAEKEFYGLNRDVSMYLDYAETQVEQHIPMTMEDWAKS